MSTEDKTIKRYDTIWGHGSQENLLEIGMSIISCVPCIRFDCYCTLHQTFSVNADVAGKKVGSYTRGHRGILLEVQSHAAL